MFIDKIAITIRSGKGGDGAVSFRREKYVPNGGPDGGDGGKGGSVLLVSDASLNSLSAFRYRRSFIAAPGQNGSGNCRSGKDAEDLTIPVPVGTAVFDASTGEAIFDFVESGQSFAALKGGRGGKGNQHFATPTRQAPKFAKPGDESVERRLLLELKTIADVGLIGYPNVGKSTLLSKVTHAKPKIADYHFTTLSPNLGVARHKNASEFVVADIPGLINGASGGAGLGLDFLRHIERTRLLVHVIDAAGSEGRDPMQDFRAINQELFAYSERLKDRPMAVFLNKADLVTGKEALEDLRMGFEKVGYRAF
ncbi:MAG: GTPase ObgE, partial [Eubacteriaceae bacterium]|nr:GTPase ObgE [Eubacteriaceae bacterium]